ncbi:Leucine Rich repeats (2 copies) [Rosistilla oblonga]|uniref:hypothetical protein n=1 Tax=Rosistilla oblonga TaxID=2527990 RepID=UPI0011894E42|nr:hypothetical protein [Rosistilla oblonga]QDV11441.1 Leucine Rich repeats (2 copies) [Rosistilla oblonga]
MSKTHLRFVVLALLCAITPFFVLPESLQAAAPNMVRIHTRTGDKYFGPLIDESKDELSIFDISAATTVSLEKKAIEIKVGDIEEVLADEYVPFASYAAWKLGKILKTGRLEATIVHNSEKGVFVNRGSDDGVETGRRCVLLGVPETIVDPTSDEVLGIIREQLGNAIPLTVVSERLSKVNFPEPLNEDAQKVIDAFATKRQVEIEQQTKRIVLAPPRWKPTADADSLTDDANFLHAQLIAELVRYGFNVVSKKQTERMRQSIADERQVDVREVPDIEIAKNAKADVLVSVDMLAKGVTCQVQLQVTDLETDEYLGIVSGSTRRKGQREESARSIAFAQGIIAGKQLGFRVNSIAISLFAFANGVSFDDDGKLLSFEWHGKPMTKRHFDLLCKLDTIKDLRLGETPLDDHGLQLLTGLSKLEHLDISGTRISDRGCETIAANFPRLSYLKLHSCRQLTNNGVNHLAQKKTLRTVILGNTNVDDEAAIALSTLPNLTHLRMWGCNVTDRGLAGLHQCTKLEKLEVRETKVTRDGVQQFKAALPNCIILFTP